MIEGSGFARRIEAEGDADCSAEQEGRENATIGCSWASREPWETIWRIPFPTEPYRAPSS